MVDRLLEDAEHVQSNLGLTPSSVEEVELLQLSTVIAAGGVRIRGLRQLVREELLAFIELFEESGMVSKSADRGGKGMGINKAFALLFEYLPQLMRHDYEGHTLLVVHALRSMVLDLIRKVVVLGTHVVELAASLKEYSIIRPSV
jgi:hypothetical protein